MRAVLAWVLVSVVASGWGCDRKAADTEDPLKKIARQRYAEGRRLFLTCDPNDLPEALKAYDDALASWEDYPEALAAWAEAVSMWYGFRLPQNVFEQAYVRAQRSIRLAPESDAGYRAMADLFRHYRDPETGKLANEEAMKSIDRALAIYPKSAENLYVQGSIMLSVKPEAAVEILRQSLFYNRDLGKSYFNLASAHQMIADRIAFSAPDPDPGKQAERMKVSQQNYQQAIDNLLIYQRLVPGDIGGYTSLGVVYLHLKRYEESEKMFRKAISVNQSPDPAQAQWRAAAYVYLGQIADQHHQDLNLSRSYLERGLEANPYDAQIYKQLISIAHIQKDEAGVKKYEELFRSMVEKAKAEMATEDGPPSLPGDSVVPQSGQTASALPGQTASPAAVGGSTAP